MNTRALGLKFSIAFAQEDKTKRYPYLMLIVCVAGSVGVVGSVLGGFDGLLRELPNYCLISLLVPSPQ